MEKNVDSSQVHPSKTSDHYKTDTDLPGRFEHPEWVKGYQSNEPHPIFRTSNMVYGSRAPSVHTVPTTFQPRSQKFTDHLAPCGMYRNNSLNTNVEKSAVTGPDNAALTKLDRLNFHKSFTVSPNV